ncbi:MAG TPA: zf-HC2 domain-containing protein [Terriglobales bacterium]|nr:zf-HC2 domain-containing protein [Terriglobales bacterium]
MSHIEPHDEFLELCAVATTGQLTGEEQQKLREHLAACSSCRAAMQQYEAVVGHALPAIAAREIPEHIDPGPGWSMDRAEAALFARIAREDEASRPAQKERRETARSTDTPRVLPFAGAATWSRVWTLYAAAILLSVALGICAYQVGIRRGVSTAILTPPPPSPQRNLALEEQLSDAGHERAIARTQIEERDRQIAELRRQLERQSADMSVMRLAQQRLERDFSAGNTGQPDLIRQRNELARKVEAAQTNAQALQNQLDSLAEQSSQDAVQAKALEAKVNYLTQQLHERDAALEQQQELLAHDRDIRELMGARDLLITEVYDVARTGETQKPYGRVFYTKGKSLIFYAYDLDQASLKAASTFQAWGRRGPDHKQALNLGIFYVDSATKKRWVLKFDDSRTLAQIDAVFVTVEPNGGSHRPSGKSLLFAYLKVDSNHP